MAPGILKRVELILHDERELTQQTELIWSRDDDPTSWPTQSHQLPKECARVLDVLERPEITARLDNQGCAGRFREIATKLKGKVVDQPLRRVYELMLGAADQQLPKLSKTTEFQRAVKASHPR